MSANFDWQTDEEGWEEERPQPEAPRPPDGRLRRRLLLVLGLAGLGALLVVLIVYRQVDQRVTAATQAVEQDVIAAHTLLTDAALAGDEDLFRSLLLAEDRFWRDRQVELLARDLWLDRGAMALWLDASRPISDVRVALAPDLTRAEVTDRLAYTVEWQTGVTDTVWLTRTAVYTRDDAQWRLAPLPDEQAFWGAWQSVEGERVVLIFAEREAAVGARLAADLDAILVQLCRETAVPCRPGQQLQLRLSRETTSPLMLAENYRAINVSSNVRTPLVYRMDLPAPTLLGLPADETAYQALLQGYANWATAVLAARASREVAASDAFVIAQLAEIGQRLPPPPGYFPAREAALPPIPFPAQDILVACQLDNRTSLWRFTPQTGNWEDLLAATGRLRPFLNLSLVWPLPGDDGLLLQLRRFEKGTIRSQIVRWADGEETVLVDDEAAYEVVSWLTPRLAADGRYLLLYRVQPADEARREQQFFVLDLAACGGGDCALQPVDGVPYWSPDGTRTLIVAAGQWPSDLYLGDEAGGIAQWIDKGWAPFWVDDGQFGYVRPAAPGGDYVAGDALEVVLAAVETSKQKRVVLRTADLAAVLPARPGGGPVRLYVNDVMQHPATGALLFSLVTWGEGDVGSGSTQHYVLYEAAGERLRYFWGVDDSSGYPMAFTENGRFFSALTADSNQWMLHLYDLEQDETTTYALQPTPDFFYPVLDWSADEAWLVLAEDRLLRLIAPAHDYELPLFHNLSGCRTAVWIGRDA